MKILNFFKRKIEKKPKHNIMLREFLMTTFLVIVVYELIAKQLATFLIKSLLNNQFANLFISKVNEGNSIISNWMFSSIQGANTNLFIVIFSLIFTGFLIGAIFKIVNLLYESKTIRKYMEGEGRRELYINEFGGKLLLTFMIFGILILILYPFLGIIMIVGLIIAIGQHKNENLSNNSKK